MRQPMLMRAMLLCFAAVPSGSRAQTAAACELHIWPSNLYSDYGQGASVGANEIIITETYRPQNRQLLEENLSIEDQQMVIRDATIGSNRLDARYHIVFHDWDASTPVMTDLLGANEITSRMSDSTSSCYTELFVMFNRYESTTLSRKIQSGFVIRRFGTDNSYQERLVRMVSNGAGAFPSSGRQARQDVQAAFRANFVEFLGSRRAHRLLDAPDP